MKTAIITSKSSLNHNTGSGHPESVSRVTSIVETLKNDNIKYIFTEKPVGENAEKIIHLFNLCNEKNVKFPLSYPWVEILKHITCTSCG